MIDFLPVINAIAAAEIYHYPLPRRIAIGVPASDDARSMTIASLMEPRDFPAILRAIVPGDHVALAVDPNIPQLETIVLAVVEYLESSATSASQPSEIDVVLGDEVSDETLASLEQILNSRATVRVHNSASREDLRYVGADSKALPVYLNRYLVDADFLLPIVTLRGCMEAAQPLLAGVFPMFADSLSRQRAYVQAMEADGVVLSLAVQVVVSVTTDATGDIASIQTGTPEGVIDAWTSQLVEDTSPVSSIIVATLDGESTQQTWLNAARAAHTAAELLPGGGTIVLWTRITEPPSGSLAELADSGEELQSRIKALQSDEHDEDGFPPWDDRDQAAILLSRVVAEYRLLLHSELSDESVEAMGIGAISTLDDLARLTRSFTTCSIIRAASSATPLCDIRLPHDTPPTQQL